jgi:hypothetical protein
MNFRYRTADGRILVPQMHLYYQCKNCGYANELLLLVGKGRQSVNPSEDFMRHESLCHKCDDVEVITFEQEEKNHG